MPEPNETPQQSILGGGNMNIDQLYQTALRITQGVLTIAAQPLEYLLRPTFGTRYFNPITTLFSCAVMFTLGGVGAFASHTPSSWGLHGVSSHGFMGLTALAMMYFIGNLAHGPRIYRRMLHPEREKHSEYEGPPLPFLAPLFARLPLGSRFWPVRIVYEPLTVLVVTLGLKAVGLFDRSAAMYLASAAIALSLKCTMEWYRSWLYLRIVLDGRAAGSVIGEVVQGTATEEQMASVHIVGFPRGVSKADKASVIAQRAGILPEHLESLISPVDKSKAA